MTKQMTLMVENTSNGWLTDSYLTIEDYDECISLNNILEFKILGATKNQYSTLHTMKFDVDVELIDFDSSALIDEGVKNEDLEDVASFLKQNIGEIFYLIECPEDEQIILFLWSKNEEHRQTVNLAKKLFIDSLGAVSCKTAVRKLRSRFDEEISIEVLDKITCYGSDYNLTQKQIDEIEREMMT